MRAQSFTAYAGLGAGDVVPKLISPKAGDTYQLRDQINFVSAFGELTDVLSPIAPISPIAKVEFFEGSTLLATATAFPWIAYLAATVLGAGSHAVYCVVTYTSGLKLNSTTKSITVAAAPATNPGSFAATKLWADGTDLTKYTPASPTPGTLVSDLTNNQGAAVFSNFTQATGVRQPTVDYIRGLPCVLFGTQSQQHFDSTIVGTVAQPWQVFMGYRQCGSGTTGTVWAGSTGGNFKITSGTSDWPMDANLNANINLLSSAAIPDSTSHVMEFQGNGASGFINLDGTVLVTGTTGTRTLQTLFSIGAGNTGAAAVSCGFTDFAVATGMSGADQTTTLNALIAKTHVNEPAGKRYDAGDSLEVGQGSTNGMGYRYMTWFGTNGVVWSFSQAKVAGRWVESHGNVNTGPGGLIGFIDDQSYGNSGKGINFALANQGAKINAGQPYAGMDFAVINWGINNARNMAGETFVPGTGVGSTYESWVNLAILYADAGLKGIVWLNITDSNPAFGTGPGSTYANIRVMNGYWRQAIAAVRAARPSFIIIPVDAFNYVGPWNATNFSDEVHYTDSGYSLKGQAVGQGIAQMCASY